MKIKQTKFKEIFVQSNGNLRTWVMFAIYAWFVLLSMIIALELTR